MVCWNAESTVNGEQWRVEGERAVETINRTLNPECGTQKGLAAWQEYPDEVSARRKAAYAVLKRWPYLPTILETTWSVSQIRTEESPGESRYIFIRVRYEAQLWGLPTKM
jgi:hypothetical protein